MPFIDDKLVVDEGGGMLYILLFVFLLTFIGFGMVE
jgi:hypothetical protein